MSNGWRGLGADPMGANRIGMLHPMLGDLSFEYEARVEQVSDYGFNVLPTPELERIAAGSDLPAAVAKDALWLRARAGEAAR